MSKIVFKAPTGKERISAIVREINEMIKLYNIPSSEAVSLGLAVAMVEAEKCGFTKKQYMHLVEECKDNYDRSA